MVYAAMILCVGPNSHFNTTLYKLYSLFFFHSKTTSQIFDILLAQMKNKLHTMINKKV